MNGDQPSNLRKDEDDLILAWRTVKYWVGLTSKNSFGDVWSAFSRHQPGALGTHPGPRGFCCTYLVLLLGHPLGLEGTVLCTLWGGLRLEDQLLSAC